MNQRFRGITGSSFAFAALALVVSATSGCDGFSAEAGTGLMRVEVRRGPLQPVAREGEEDSAQVANARVVVRAGGRALRSGRTDTQGQLQLMLAAGVYTVEVTDCPGALSLPAPEEVGVSAEGRTDVTLECDTGIR
jgi:hypothetical protein